MLGVDVSNNNGPVDWQKAAGDGVRFAWVKATEGRTFNDSYLARNLAGARQHNVKVGTYHFARPDSNTPEAEADHFLSVYHVYWGDLLPVLDLETRGLSQAAMTTWAKRWMSLVQQGLHCDVVLYTYPYFLRDNLDASRLAGTKLWYADYTGKPGKFNYLSFTKGMQVVAQQYTSAGTVGGVSGHCDLNYAKSLAPILQTKPKSTKSTRALPGPSPKPRWFWAALKQYLANRKK